ncbi:putative leucine-rich repeat-containing protein DDB G0290503 [Scophthalmus maximus]|uniref:Putative leucine-rich repeat-containing protein DDB G0290503 n=1 Tax=Scophthalmus maximus TaxID=52904 RepID=A0A2U9CND7_SCOMX|nr:putative leucine-rich repeat-containing protein DDB G0290503 [Scophthalmus maximus]KAF0025079.1 hypothetical protein F2P81_021960 [Scophthalmus maximus]
MDRQQDHREELMADLQQAEQDLACQTERLRELTTKLEMETTENQSLSDQVEYLKAELKKEQTWSLRQRDRLEELKNAHQHQPLAANQCNLATQDHEWLDLKKSNFEPQSKLKTEKRIAWALKREAAKLSAMLETEKEKSNSLSKQEEYLQTELQKDRTWKLELRDQLQKQKDAQQQELETAKFSNAVPEALLQEWEGMKKSNLQLMNKLKIEKDIITAREREAVMLSIRLESETTQNNASERESVCDQLRKQRNWRMKLIDQFDKQKVAHEQELKAAILSDIECEALYQELESLKATNLKLVTKLKAEEELSRDLQRETTLLSVSLEEETNKNKSLSQQGESLMTELQEEQTWRLGLSDLLQKEKDSHQQRFEALRQELEDQKATNNENLIKLHAEKEAGQALQRETGLLREEQVTHTECVFESFTLLKGIEKLKLEVFEEEP